MTHIDARVLHAAVVLFFTLHLIGHTDEISLSWLVYRAYISFPDHKFDEVLGSIL